MCTPQVNGTQLSHLLEYLKDLELTAPEDAASDGQTDDSAPAHLSRDPSANHFQADVTPESELIGSLMTGGEGEGEEDEDEEGGGSSEETEDEQQPCRVVLVLVHAHWCPFSAALRGVVEAAARQLPHVVAVAVEKSKLRPR